MAHGFIEAASIPGWPTPPQGVMEQCAEALANAGFANVVSNTPDGIMVSDVDTAKAFFASYVGSANQLAFNKDATLKALADIYASKCEEGFNYAGPDGIKRSFQIDPASQFNIDVQANAALGAILAGEDWFTGAYFIAYDNTHMALPTAQDMRKFALATRTYVSSLILINRMLKDTVAAVTTLDALEAINLNLTALWPTNN